MAGDRKAHPDCVNASNPFHVCADYCIKRSPSPKLNIHGVQSPARYGRNVDYDCVNASNPFHQCADYCTKKKKESETGKSGHFTFPVLKLSPRSPSSSERSDGGKAAQNRKGVEEDRRSIDAKCVNASDPFHICGDYCTKKTVDTTKHTGTEVQNGESIKLEVRKMEEGMKEDLMSVPLSGPFHQCNEHRAQGIAEDRKSVTLGALLAKESEEELAGRKNSMIEAVGSRSKKVDPACPNASNPFHECAEYCLQKIGESGRSLGSKSDRSRRRSDRSEGGKSDRSKGSSNIVMDRTEVDPRCVNASNPFHKCAEYCFDRIQESA